MQSAQDTLKRQFKITTPHAEIVIIRFILSSETIIEFLAKSEIVVFELVNLDQGKIFFL